MLLPARVACLCPLSLAMWSALGVPGEGVHLEQSPAARHCAPVVHASQRHVSGLLVRGEGSEELKRKSKEEYFATIFQEPETLEPHNMPVNITCNRL